jgi:prolyl-tRNA synthetase
MSDDKLRQFIEKMRGLESSFGANTDHDTIKEGIHAGSTAIGVSGLMPNTAKEFANRRRIQGMADELDKQVLQSENKQVEEMLKSDPKLYERYEQALAEKVLKRSNDRPELAAVMWRYGHNLRPERAEKILESNPGYRDRITKFKNIVDQMNKKKMP